MNQKVNGIGVGHVNVHSDQRRDIYPAFNSESGEFLPGQVKVLKVKEDCWLGGTEGHFHDYAETYLQVGNGSAIFYLQNVDDLAQREKITLRDGDILRIPPHVAHKVHAGEDVILIGLTEQPYRGPEQDISFAVQTDD